MSRWSKNKKQRDGYKSGRTYFSVSIGRIGAVNTDQERILEYVLPINLTYEEAAKFNDNVNLIEPSLSIKDIKEKIIEAAFKDHRRKIPNKVNLSKNRFTSRVMASDDIALCPKHSSFWKAWDHNSLPMLYVGGVVEHSLWITLCKAIRITTVRNMLNRLSLIFS